MSIISIDLGTTNTKVTEYDRGLEILSSQSSPVDYDQNGDIVEFEAEKYVNEIRNMLHSCTSSNPHEHVDQIIITGQAETLVILDENGNAISPIVSWLDKRSIKECHELSERFGDAVYSITGQPTFIPTWPATKILWFRRNKPEVFSQASRFLLLQDYIIYRLTGRYATDYTIAGFSCYFDIIQKRWWADLLDYIGIKESQLPEILPPNTIVGSLEDKMFDKAGCLDSRTQVNSGLLDHFAGMVGTGNIHKGIVSESAGTVLSLATLVDAPIEDSGIPTYCGPFPGTYVLLPVCESGGICLEWFKKEFVSDKDFKEIDQAIKDNMNPNPPIFLPYVAGTNAPRFDEKARGVFIGFTTSTTKYDFALAIMNGVGCMLRENVEFLEKNGIAVDSIISTGGGAKSSLWTQVKSNFTGKDIQVPCNSEAPSLGAAILASVACGYFSSLEEAIGKAIRISKSYNPIDADKANIVYEQYSKLYSVLSSQIWNS